MKTKPGFRVLGCRALHTSIFLLFICVSVSTDTATALQQLKDTLPKRCQARLCQQVSTSSFGCRCKREGEDVTENPDTFISAEGRGKRKRRRKRGRRRKSPRGKVRIQHRPITEYPYKKPDKGRYRQMYAEAYDDGMKQRVYTAISRGTAVGRFSRMAINQVAEKFRSKRSAEVFKNNKLNAGSIIYYTLESLPGTSQREDSFIAAAFSDWSAKVPICFRERVSSWDPPAAFSVTVKPARVFARRTQPARTVSANGMRQIQLNSEFSFAVGNASSALRSQVSLPAVIHHEMGHLLGVPHGTNRATSSVMYKFFDAKNADNFINNYERRKIKQMYGSCSGRTDAITDILFEVGSKTYCTTFISRDTAVWEYSYEHNRALDDYPVRNSQVFPGISGTIDAMVQIHLNNFPGTTPPFYVFKGTMAHQFTYNYHRTPRIRPSRTKTISSLTKGRMSNVDAAIWSGDASVVYLFSGTRVCGFGPQWDYKFCNRIDIVFPGLGNERIDEAYQFMYKGKIECVFFRSKTVYRGTFNGFSWEAHRKGTVPLTDGYRWNDLCENLC